MSEEIRVLILDIFVVNRGNTDDIQRMEVNAIQMALNFEIEVVDEDSADYDIIHDYARLRFKRFLVLKFLFIHHCNQQN
jgi:hypothetical protein